MLRRAPRGGGRGGVTAGARPGPRGRRAPIRPVWAPRPPVPALGSVACAHRPITRFMGPAPPPARGLCLGRSSTNIAHSMPAVTRPNSYSLQRL